MLLLCYGVFTMYGKNYEFDDEAKMSIQLLVYVVDIWM